MTITKQQMRNLHRLLNGTGLLGRKHALVWEATGHRSESSRDLSALEAQSLIRFLEKKIKQDDKADRMRKKIISMAREMNYEVTISGKKKADMNRISSWCEKYGYLHKPLNDYTEKELPRLVTQFEGVYISFIMSI